MAPAIITDRFGFALAGSVFCAALLILTVGWGFNVAALVRPGPGANALVPGSALVLALLSFASLPILSERVALVQIGAVILALIFVVAVGLPALLAHMPANGWLVFPPRLGDGFSLASQAGALLAAITPLVRLRVFQRLSGLGVTAAFLGLVYFLCATVLIALLPWEINAIPTLQYLSLHTSTLFTVLFAAQLVIQLNSDAVLADDDDILSV
ncbi:hypothetical protein [Pseudooceanicola onchidii]|uniref:hypothetical protein n=1 Tax=Pseudooceanicola onchidii TaxID=2562279 RepID=UPI0010AA3576|nr:hypothetical protein [Pseudooceanicola onchidii]